MQSGEVLWLTISLVSNSGFLSYLANQSDARKWFTGPKITLDEDDLIEEQMKTAKLDKKDIVPVGDYSPKTDSFEKDVQE